MFNSEGREDLGETNIGRESVDEKLFGDSFLRPTIERKQHESFKKHDNCLRLENMLAGISYKNDSDQLDSEV